MTAAGGKIRVAHLIWSLQIGGAENQVALLLSNLDPSRFELHLITFKDSESGFQDMLPNHVVRHCIDFRRRNSPVSLYRLYRILKDNLIEILHCHMYGAALYGSVIGGLASVPAVLTSEHGKNSWKNAAHYFFERNIVSRLVVCRVAVSEDIRRIRVQKDGIPSGLVVVIPNAVDTNVPVSDNRGQPKRLGALGRLVAAKDYGALLAALKVLRNNGEDVGLAIAGEGEEQEKLVHLIDELELSEYAQLVGNQNATDFLDNIDVFVMSSIREGTPVALLEAMAHGLPIAATDVGGIPEVIDQNRDGLLCPAREPEMLAENILTIIKGSDIRIELGRNARRKVLAKYGIDRVADDWAELYMKLMNNGIKNEI